MDGKDVLLVVAFGTAVLAFAAPIIAFCYAKSFVRYAPYSYVFTVVTSGLWAVYGIDWDMVPLCWISGIGAVLGAAYVFLFLWRSDPDDPRLTYLLRWTAGGAVLLVVAVAFDLIVGKSTVYRVICCAASCFASAAPFYNAPTASREKSMRTMPHIALPILNLTNAVPWIIRNTIMRATKDVDYYLVVASGFSALCALMQLGMHALFRRQPPRTGLEKPLLDGAEDGDQAGKDSESDTDSDESGDNRQPGDREDEHRVVVASSSDEEVADAADEVDQLPPAEQQPEIVEANAAV